MITVHYFARFHELTALREETVEWQAGWSIATFRIYLAQLHPAIAPLLARSRLALDDQIVGEETLIPDQAEIALLPPVSGG